MINWSRKSTIMFNLKTGLVVYAIYSDGNLSGPDGAVAMSSANGLVGTGFASAYRLEPRAGF